MDFAKHRKARDYKKSDMNQFPKGILDIIEAYYPDKYVKILRNYDLLKTLFTEEEWIDILAKSRNSHESHISRRKK